MKLVKIGMSGCPSCILTNDIMSELKKEYGDKINIVSLDYLFDYEEVKKIYDGTIVPTVIIYNDFNEEITRIIGDQDKKQLEEIINLN